MSTATAIPPRKAFAALADTLKMAGDATRLRILHVLADGEQNVGDLCRLVGDMAQPALSHHLKLLSLARLVEPTRRGKYNHYALTAKWRAMHAALAALAESTEAAR